MSHQCQHQKIYNSGVSVNSAHYDPETEILCIEARCIPFIEESDIEYALVHKKYFDKIHAAIHADDEPESLESLLAQVTPDNTHGEWEPEPVEAEGVLETYESIEFGDFEFRRYTDGYTGIKEYGLVVNILNPAELSAFVKFATHADDEPENEAEADCCGNCFFECPGFRDGDPVFECHYNAPQKTHGVGTGYEEHRWSEVEYDKWCGKHRPKE